MTTHMTAQRMHPTAARSWLLAVLLLTITLVTTACGSGLEAHAAAADSQVSDEQVSSQGSLRARGVSGAASTAQDVNADAIAGPDAAIYRVGQTAAVGSLRVTLDKAAVAAGEAGNVADAGQRFVLVYLTVQNTGKEAQSLSLFSTMVTDMGGRRYFAESSAGFLSTARPLGSSIAPGDRTSGNRGYMLPVDAGDLTWTGEDAVHNRVTFAIRATDIVTPR
jgi:hypothetical protein